jgi:hypothetical protein
MLPIDHDWGSAVVQSVAALMDRVDLPFLDLVRQITVALHATAARQGMDAVEHGADALATGRDQRVGANVDDGNRYVDQGTEQVEELLQIGTLQQIFQHCGFGWTLHAVAVRRRFPWLCGIQLSHIDHQQYLR